jgi:hypothetical protein
MKDPLATYLRDHLAGSHFAIKLLTSLGEQFNGQDLGAFALALRTDLQQDQDTLEELLECVGKAQVDLSEVTGWLAERASQCKLERAHSGAGIGTFEALETLTLGIQGKKALWHALTLIRGFDKRIPALDFHGLISRAEGQYRRTEKGRIQLIDETFRQKT